jgi:hypothetical protein
LITARALTCCCTIGRQTESKIVDWLLAGEEDSPVYCTLIVEYRRCITGGDLLR